jgi:hypothetical protein
MTSFSEMFDSAVDEGYGPDLDLAVGKYEGAFTFANTGKTKSGDPSIGLLFKADDGSKSAAGEDMSGGVRWFNLYFSPAAMNFAVRDAKALGLTPAMLDTDIEAAAQSAVGQRWAVTVKLSKDGQYTNIFIDKRLDAAAAAPSPAPAPAAAAGGDTWEI